MSAYENEREKIRKEVHDDTTRLLAAALADNAILLAQIDNLKELLAHNEGELKDLQRKTALESIPEEYQVFAADLNDLCRKHGFYLQPSMEHVGLDIVERPQILKPCRAYGETQVTLFEV